MARSFTITFDAADPQRLASFWAVALDYEFQQPPPEFETWDEFADRMGIPVEDRDKITALIDPTGTGPRILFLKVPEPKTAKNRVHLDVHSGSHPGMLRDDHLALVREHVDRLIAAGARELESHEELGARWTVMQDPEGNEFCVV
jgi:hypothetical protein